MNTSVRFAFKRLLAISVLLFHLFLSGCIVFSQDPGYIKGTTIMDPDLVGDWVELKARNANSPDVLTFLDIGDQSYTMIATSSEGDIRYLGNLFEIDEIKFLDIEFIGLSSPELEVRGIHIISRIENLSHKEFSMSLISEKEFRKLIKSSPDIIEYKEVTIGNGKDKIMAITSPATIIQDFLVSDNVSFIGPIKYVRPN